jgi:hypothetical protein
MTWLTLRQFRTAALSVLGALVVVAAMLAVTGPQVAELLRSSGDDFFPRFSDDRVKMVVFHAGTALMFVLPAVVGAFWGAPLVARELEAGTHRLVWSQSVGRVRWLVAKLGITAVAAVVAGSIGLAFTWWCGPIDDAIAGGQDFNGLMAVPRLAPALFGSRGVVPLAMTVLALVIGVTAGLLVRRAVPAMAVTLVAVVGLQIALPLMVQSHLVEPDHLTTTITADNFAGMRGTPPANGSGPTVDQFEVSLDAPGAWVTSNQTVGPSGAVADDIPQWASECAPPPGGPSATADACFDRLADEGYRQAVEYFPAGRFWTMQAVEAGLLLGTAAGLAGFCFWRIRRDLT